MAQAPTSFFGVITPPIGQPVELGAPKLLGNLLRLFFAAAGLWAFLNILLAGFQFINAGGDPKNIQAAWGKIWQSLVGLAIIVTSFIFAAIIGYVIFGDPGYILRPTIFNRSGP